LCPELHLTDFGYRLLAEEIAGSTGVSIDYCVGEIKRRKGDKISERLYSGQQSLFYSLEKQKIMIEKGFMLKSKGIYHEKGVDVRIALNILKGALKNTYDTCYLISSDTDMIPAIKDARGEGKTIVYVGFENFISNALKANCSKTYIIKKKLLKRMK